MRKLSIVRLTKRERVALQSVVTKLQGTGQKVRRAQMLLQADANGPHWIDEHIAEAYACRISTVERLRQRFVEHGCDAARNRVARPHPPVAKRLTGDQEARIIATRLGPPPQGSNNWTLRLLARQVVAWAIVDSVRDETIRRTLKKTV
jgi:hypothetical protein